MRNSMRLLLMCALTLLISLPMFAQSAEVSTLPITERTQVGTEVLEPGTYMIRVLHSAHDRDKIQITNADRSKIYVSALTVPHPVSKDEEKPNTQFVFFPAGEGMPRALRTWYAASPKASDGGHDIVYEAKRAEQLARLYKTRVVSYGDATVADLETTPLSVVTPDAKVETYTYTAPETTVAETTPEPTPMISSSEPVTQVAEATPVEMPHTASHMPLFLVLGLGSLVAAGVIRYARS